MDKMTFGLGAVGALCVLLGFSWYVGKDGSLTTATFALIGAIIGTLLGFQFAAEKIAK